MDETRDESIGGAGDASRVVAGVIIIQSNDAAAWRVLPLRRELVLGRERELPNDDRLSRVHVSFESSAGRIRVRDLGSRNGTFVDGRKIEEELLTDGPHVVRIGRTLLVVRPDLRHHLGRGIEVQDGAVVGPLLRDAFDGVRSAARAGGSVLIHGESGTGTERCASLFHKHATPNGPFVVVNCATIPQGVAERLLFGAKRGAYSGAENAEGYVQAAERGVLFLDEFGELDLDVQAKLLRVLEAREVLPLGGTSPRKIDVRFCFATHRDLRAHVAAGKFRADLYHRIVHPEVRLPPLRERPEEVPELVRRELASIDPGLSPHVKFVEACMTRHWPGNVRELLQHVRRAAGNAKSAKESAVQLEHLDPRAGEAFDLDRNDQAAHTRESLEAALTAANGNVSQTARSLGLHRTQLYRLLRRFGLGTKEDEG
ncbi:MAG: sigma 54-interacting transcriptional regulator [Polyangiales bacterium]